MSSDCSTSLFELPPICAKNELPKNSEVLLIEVMKRATTDFTDHTDFKKQLKQMDPFIYLHPCPSPKYFLYLHLKRWINTGVYPYIQFMEHFVAG
jgi:hypothetical protein